MRRLILSLLLALAAPATADDPVFTGPPGEYRVQAPASVRVIRGATSITFDWGTGPVPRPVDPPPPGPIDPPPVPPPVPTTWGPLERVVVLYESDALTGREPIYSPLMREALTAVTPADPNGLPRWRFWDRDLDVTAEGPEWIEAKARARVALGNDTGPTLFALDPNGRVRKVAVGTRNPADVAAAIRNLAQPTPQGSNR